jgi:hypothetical protein
MQQYKSAKPKTSMPYLWERLNIGGNMGSRVVISS